ncbi:MAG: hypothetical protein PSX71_01900 [bacterium]|nr:hypothetical protein [bacterium]
MNYLSEKYKTLSRAHNKPATGGLAAGAIIITLHAPGFFLP